MANELNWRQEELLDQIDNTNVYRLQTLFSEVGWDIKAAAQQGASDFEWLDSQAMCVVEEAGEFIGEYRRLRGFARRPGNKEDMLSELADVVISASLMFFFLNEAMGGADMSDELKKKLRKIVTRGYVNKDPA